MEELRQIEPEIRLRFKNQVSRVRVNRDGTLAALTSKSILCIVSLNTPYSMTTTLSPPTRSPCGPGSWSPFNNTLASHSGKNIYLWDLASGGRSATLLTTLQQKRNVRSAEWSPFEEGLVATTAADNAVRLWDLRDARSPVQTKEFSGFPSGLSQAKWNRHNRYVLASALDRQVEIWDIRRQAPLTFITAHPTKIFDLDWSYSKEEELLTCSQDKTLKLWNYNTSRICLGTVECGAPVLRGCFSPLGDSLVLAVTQYDTQPHLWRRNNLSSPAFRFTGATAPLTDCDWQLSNNGGGNNNKQLSLVGWSKDNHVCVWRLGHEEDASDAEDSSEFAGSSSFVMDDSGIISESLGGGVGSAAEGGQPGGSARTSPTHSSSQPQSLTEEFAYCEGHPVENVRMDQVSTVTRTAIVTAQGSKHTLQLKISFPTLYPHGSSPSFEFLPSTTVSREAAVALTMSLQRCAQDHLMEMKACVYPILLLISESVQGDNLEKLVEQRTRNTSTPVSMQSIAPRISGARFSAGGKLVYFCSPNHIQIFDSLPLNQCSREAAAEYALRGDAPSSLAEKNAVVAESVNKKHIAVMWRTVAQLTKAEGDHPLQRMAISSILDHLEKTGDIQTLVTMLTVLSPHEPLPPSDETDSDEGNSWAPESPKFEKEIDRVSSSPPRSRALSQLKKLASPFKKKAMVPPSSPILANNKSPRVRRRLIANPVLSPPISRIDSVPNRTSDALHSHARYMRAVVIYAEMLYQWQLFEKRGELVGICNAHYKPRRLAAHQGLELIPLCGVCGSRAAGAVCKRCNVAAFSCALCRQPVRGVSSICSKCGHGGHALHMQQWFLSHSECPSGCGCQCNSVNSINKAKQ